MRGLSVNVILAADTGTPSTVTGIQIDANQIIAASFQAVFGDTGAAGTFKIQASNDVAPIQYTSQPNASTFEVTNWTDIPNATASIASGASALITLSNVSYRWLRAVYVWSSGGTTTITVNMYSLSM